MTISREFLDKIVNDDDGETQMDLRWREIQEMARELLATRWTPITSENLPKAGDEVLAIFPRGERKIWGVCADWMAEMAGSSTSVVRQYRRPINPPLPAPPEGKP